MNTTPARAGIIEHIDPHNLDVAANVRDEAEATLDREFLDSIRANGVIVPIVATRDEHGVHVRYGQRRTLGAQNVGLASVPVYIVNIDQADDAQRIIEQLIENDQRRDITEANRIKAWKALELEGLSATAIAKRTGTKRDKIKTGLAVASSDTGTRLVAEAGITLDQAATLLEFEDAPDTVKNLTEIATEDPDYFPHAVQRARDDRAATQAREAAEQIETAKGHRVLTEHPDYYEGPARLHQVRTSDGKHVNADAIQGKEGVAVHVVGFRDGTVRISYFLDDPTALGYTLTEQPTPQHRGGPMTDEQKKERKQLIANNKEWDAAESVRREWLAMFLSRKTLPKDTTQVIARSLTEGRRLVSDAMSQGNSLAADLLRIDAAGNHPTDRFANYLHAHPTKAGHVALAIILGGIESNTDRGTWRNPRPETAHYLQTLSSWGYPLSPVERIAAMTDSTES